MPIRSAGHSGTVGILRLVTAHAVQSGHPFARRTANNICEVTVPVIALLRISCRCVTVDAAWRSQYRIHLLPRAQSIGEFPPIPVYELSDELIGGLWCVQGTFEDRAFEPAHVAAALQRKTGSSNRWFTHIVASLRYDHSKIARGCQFQSEPKGGFALKVTLLPGKSNCGTNRT